MMQTDTSEIGNKELPAASRATVLLDGNEYSSGFQTKELHRSKWQEALEQAHGAGVPAVCLCGGDGARRLAVRCIAGIYRLARYPNSGHEHAIHCRYYGPNVSGSGLRSYAAGVVREDDEGILHVRLTHGIGRRKSPATGTNSAPPPTGSGRAPPVPSMTLLGLLHLIWMQAGLHRWDQSAGTRDDFSIARQLRKAAHMILAGRHPLADALVTTTGRAGNLREAADRAIAAARDGQRRIVCVAALRPATAPWEGRYVPLHQVPALPTTILSDMLWERLQDRFGRELAAWRRGRRLIVIGMANNPCAPAEKWEWHDLALRPVTDDWVPVDSEYEAQLADHLVAEGRSFEKPLRFDAHTQESLEDFILTDTRPSTALEVFGMNTPEYIARRDAKFILYNANVQKPWWYWDATQGALATRLRQFPLPVATLG